MRCPMRLSKIRSSTCSRCLETGRRLLSAGRCHPEIARIGQQIVDSAALSAREKRTVRAGRIMDEEIYGVERG